MKEFTWVFGLVGNLLVFVGWIVVFLNAKNISTRSEIKSIVDTIVKTLNEVSEKGMKFWFNQGSDYTNHEHYTSMIMSNITLISQLIIFIQARGGEADANLNKLINTLTLDCDSVLDMEPQQRTLRANEINAEAMEIITGLMTSFHDKYPPTHYVDLDNWYRKLSSY